MVTVESVDFNSPDLGQEAWDQLLLETPEDHVFLTRQWMSTWWRFFGEGRSQRIVLIRQDGKLRNVLPLMLFTDRLFRPLAFPTIRTLRLTANYHSNRVDIIGEELDSQVLKSLWSHLIGIPGWNLFRLFPIPADSPNLPVLQSFAEKEGIALTITPSQRSPYLEFGLGWEKYRGTLSQKTRKFGRKAEKAAAEGALVFETVRGNDDWRSALEEIFQLSGRTWSAQQGTSIGSTPTLRGFYSALAEVAAQLGWLHLDLLRKEGELIAFDYNLVYRDTLYCLKGGYDPRFQDLRPGYILTWYSLSQALGEGSRIRRVDFLGEADAYKLKWTSQIRSHVKVTLYRPGSVLVTGLKWLETHLAGPVRRWRKEQA